MQLDSSMQYCSIIFHCQQSALNVSVWMFIDLPIQMRLTFDPFWNKPKINDDLFPSLLPWLWWPQRICWDWVVPLLSLSFHEKGHGSSVAQISLEMMLLLLSHLLRPLSFALFPLCYSDCFHPFLIATLNSAMHSRVNYIDFITPLATSVNRFVWLCVNCENCARLPLCITTGAQLKYFSEGEGVSSLSLGDLPILWQIV